LPPALLEECPARELEHHFEQAGIVTPDELGRALDAVRTHLDLTEFECTGSGESHRALERTSGVDSRV
jgi:hypothetical protein